MECSNTGIFILDCLKDTDLQTARSLYDDIDGYNRYDPVPTITYRRIQSRDELVSFMGEMLKYCHQGGFPLLHFELHGNKDQGIFVGRGLREINIACRNNLVVVMAGCYGIYAVSEIAADEPSPFFFLAGFNESVESGVVQEHIANFYRTLLAENSLSDAISAIKNNVPSFLAEEMFVLAMIGYFRDHSRGRGKAARVEKLLTRWVELHPNHSIEEFRAYRTRLRKFLKASIEEFQRNANLFLHSRYHVEAEEVFSFLEALPGKKTI
jgi:hypothetical protein